MTCRNCIVEAGRLITVNSKIECVICGRSMRDYTNEALSKPRPETWEDRMNRDIFNLKKAVADMEKTMNSPPIDRKGGG